MTDVVGKLKCVANCSEKGKALLFKSNQQKQPRKKRKKKKKKKKKLKLNIYI